MYRKNLAEFINEHQYLVFLVNHNISICLLYSALETYHYLQ